MNFKDFKKDVESAFNNMIAENLFVANVDKDLLWMGYLLSFEDETVRGFFNEYLRADLEKEHRRVFEALGSRAKAEYSDDQLSGLGFSSTSHNDVVVKVDNKSFKIIF